MVQYFSQTNLSYILCNVYMYIVCFVSQAGGYYDLGTIEHLTTFLFKHWFHVYD